jgi:hypothetical protein
MITAALVIECYLVFVANLLGAQVHVAIRRVVTTWLAVSRAPKPPWGAIRCPPRLLVEVLGIHGVRRASATTILWASNVDDPVRFPERLSRSQYSSPIALRRWREKLRATRTTALVLGPADIVTIAALDDRASMVMSFKSNTAAFASAWAALPRLCGNFLNSAAWNRSLALRESWEWCKFSPLVRTSCWIQLARFAFCPRRDSRILDDQEIGVHCCVPTSINLFVIDISICECIDKT